MGFSAPAFLWGLTALAIPVVVHLFNFRRYRKVYFSNVDRLAGVQSESRRRSELKQWLVLTMRMLAVAFLVLAFARPVVGGNAESAAGGGGVVSIYVDNTFSMEAASEEGSRLDIARRKVREIVAAYAVDTRFQLLTSDLSGGEMVWLNRDELLQALDEVQPTASAPMLSQAVERQLGFMRQSGAPWRRGYVVSDFQRSGSDLAALPADSMALVTLVPVEGGREDNVYVDTLGFNAPAYMAGGVVELTATVRNSGSREVEKVPVKLVVNGSERAVATVDVAAGAAATAAMSFRLGDDEWIDGWVEVSDYPVVFDNRYYFSLNAVSKVRVEEVQGRQAGDELERLFGTDSAVAYRRQKADETGLGTDCDLLVLNGVEALSTGDVQQVASWVNEGGSLAMVPPAGRKQQELDALNSLLAAAGAPLLGKWLERSVRASRVDLSNGLYRGVFSGQSEEMEMPTVRGHYTIEGQQAHQPLIALADGGTLLVEARAGQGRVYLFSSPLSAEWSDFASQASFVPTVYNMALYSRPSPQAFHTIGAASVVALQGNYSPDRQPPELTDGEGMRVLPDIRRVGGRQQLLLHGEIVHDGVYRLADEHLAFNYARRESDMETYTRDEVALAMQDRKGYEVAVHADRPLTDEIVSRRSGRQLWRWCLVLALVALAAETLILKQRRS